MILFHLSKVTCELRITKIENLFTTLGFVHVHIICKIKTLDELQTWLYVNASAEMIMDLDLTWIDLNDDYVI